MVNVLFTKQVVEVLHEQEGQHATIRAAQALRNTRDGQQSQIRRVLSSI